MWPLKLLQRCVYRSRQDGGNPALDAGRLYLRFLADRDTQEYWIGKNHRHDFDGKKGRGRGFGIKKGSGPLEDVVVFVTLYRGRRTGGKGGGGGEEEG